MFPAKDLRPLSQNRILAALPREEYERLRSYQKQVHLVQGNILYDAGDHIRHLYFPMSGMVSLLSTTLEGESIEVGMIGNEGVAGLPAILRMDAAPYRVIVQLPGRAVRIRADVLREVFNKGGQLQDLLLKYTHALLTQIAQSAACNRFHTVEERLCRWLLVCYDRLHSDTVYFTQEFLSQMLGVPRTTVTMVAGNLQRAGLIHYSRGKIHVLDRRGMEAASCECYQVVREGIHHFFAA